MVGSTQRRYLDYGRRAQTRAHLLNVLVSSTVSPLSSNLALTASRISRRLRGRGVLVVLPRCRQRCRNGNVHLSRSHLWPWWPWWPPIWPLRVSSCGRGGSGGRDRSHDAIEGPNRAATISPTCLEDLGDCLGVRRIVNRHSGCGSEMEEGEGWYEPTDPP